jgi:hypothetical protein
MSKYDPLQDFLEPLASHLAEVTLSFDQIEGILGFDLPPSAYKHRAWWSNPSSPHQHPYAQAWLAAGWKVDTVNQDEKWVRFTRMP